MWKLASHWQWDDTWRQKNSNEVEKMHTTNAYISYKAWLRFLHLDAYIFIFPSLPFHFHFVGTKNIVNLCIKCNVPRLIYTSSASVTLTPYLGKAPFAVVVNQTESKVKPAASDSSLIIPGYSVTKLRAERIVLGAHGTNLPNGTGATFHLITNCQLIWRIK